MDREATLAKAVDQILKTIILRYKPEKVILFGSLATGDVEEWSDLDLVVIKETSQPFLQRAEELALLCMAPVGVDYLVYTPAEFDQMVAEKNPFILKEILRKGKTLYERKSASGQKSINE